MKPAILIAAVAIGLFRPALLFIDVNPHVQSSYEAAAHLVVGGLCGAWLARTGFGLRRLIPLLLVGWLGRYHRWEIRVASVLVWIELICFAVTLARKFV